VRLSETIAGPLVAAFDATLGVRRARPLNERSRTAAGPAPESIDEALAAALSRLLAQLNRPEAVDYGRLSGSAAFREYLRAASWLGQFDPATLDERRARAFWLNTYNGLVIHAVVARRVTRSVLLDPGFFRRNAYLVGGQRVSLDDIEHGVLRGNAPHPFLRVRAFRPADPRRRWTLPCDPRVHFALVCAARSCPRLAVYEGYRLEEQLEAATAGFLAGGGVVAEPGALRLSPIFRWYADDFGGERGVRTFLSRYVSDSDVRQLLAGGAPVRYERWDWRLNGVAAARRGRSGSVSRA